jgi:transposase
VGVSGSYLTTRNRARYERKGLRYESDLTDEEYALIEPLLPPERSISRRSLINGILYVLTTGCQWRQLPKDFPPPTAPLRPERHRLCNQHGACGKLAAQ